MFQKGLTHARTHALTRTRTWVPTWRRQKSIRVATSSTTSCAFSIVRKLTYRYKRDHWIALPSIESQLRPCFERRLLWSALLGRRRACVCMCVGACEWVDALERERVCVCVCVCVRARERKKDQLLHAWVCFEGSKREGRKRVTICLRVQYLFFCEASERGSRSFVPISTMSSASSLPSTVFLVDVESRIESLSSFREKKSSGSSLGFGFASPTKDSVPPPSTFHAQHLFV